HPRSRRLLWSQLRRRAVRVRARAPPASHPGAGEAYPTVPIRCIPRTGHPRGGSDPLHPVPYASRSMELALHMGYWGGAPIDVMPLIHEAERLGFGSVWSAEAYGSDAVTTVAWVAARTERIGVGTAIMQIPAR